MSMVSFDDWIRKEINPLFGLSTDIFRKDMSGSSTYKNVRKWFESTFVDGVPPVKQVIRLVSEIPDTDKSVRCTWFLLNMVPGTSLLRDIVLDASLPTRTREIAIGRLIPTALTEAVRVTVVEDRSNCDSLRVSAIEGILDCGLLSRLALDRSESVDVRVAAIKYGTRLSSKITIAFDDTESYQVRAAAIRHQPHVVPPLLAYFNISDDIRRACVLEYLEDFYDSGRDYD